MSTLNTQINSATGIAIRLDAVEQSNAKKIASDEVIKIRQTNLALEYTTDGTTWLPVSSAGTVEWGDIIGDITNQTDLVLKFSNINDSITLLTNNINNHKLDTNNPHSVTKAQIGLGNVDNTADIDKPVSTLQQAAINAVLNQTTVQAMTKVEYEALTTKDANTIYCITDLDN